MLGGRVVTTVTLLLARATQYLPSDGNAYCGIARGPIYKPHVLKSINARNGNGSVIEYKNEVILSPEEKKMNTETLLLAAFTASPMRSPLLRLFTDQP